MDRLKALLQSAQTPDDVFNGINKEMPVGGDTAPSVLESRGIDPSKFTPTKTPMMTDKNYQDWQNTLKDYASYHVNGSNHKIMNAAINGLNPGKDFDSAIKSVYDLDPDSQVYTTKDKSPYLIEDKNKDVRGATADEIKSGKQMMNGITFNNAPPMKPEVYLGNNPDIDTTYLHELKHVKDINSPPQLKMPNFQDLMPTRTTASEPSIHAEGFKDIDSLIKALANNNSKELYKQYSGDHFDQESSIPEDAMKFSKFKNLLNNPPKGE